METKLITGLVDRTSALLPFPVGNQPRLGDLKQNTSAIIQVSKYRLSAVIEGLLLLYEKLITVPTPAQESAQIKLAESRYIVFDLFSKALSSAIRNKKLDLRFDDDFLIEKEEDEEEDEDDDYNSNNNNNSNSNTVMPSPRRVERKSDVDLISSSGNANLVLEEQHAQNLLRYLCDTLFKPQPFLQVKLQRIAARVMFKLSVVNFDAVFGKIERSLRSMKSDENTDPTVFKMLEYLNFDSEKLSRLVSLLVEMAPKFKKLAYNALAKPLRQAIWNWISNYVTEFVTLCQNKQPLPGKPDALFDIIDTWVNKSDQRTRKALMWPAQIMLLLLCPDILSNCVMLVKQGHREDKNKKYAFLDALLKALKGKEKVLSESTSVYCFVDVYKASVLTSKNDMSALRLLVPDVQNHLQDRLMDPANPFKAPDGTVDVRLMVDFLVSSFRLNHHHVTSYVFPICFRGPPVFKLAMTKAMLLLAQEGSALPWHPTLSVAYSFLAKPVRLLFQDLIQEERNSESLKPQESSASTGKKGSIVVKRNAVQDLLGIGKKSEPKPEINETNNAMSTMSFTTETLLTLLAVFFEVPKLVLENISGNPSSHINEMLYLFGGLCNCIKDITDPLVQRQSYRLMKKMFKLKFMESWCPQDLATGFVEISSSILTHFSTMLVADKDLKGDAQTLTILNLMKELTSSSNRFLVLHQDKFAPEHFAHRKRIQALENTECALLILLCSTEDVIWSTALSCFGDLCNQIDIAGDMECPANSVAMNYFLYRQLASIAETVKVRSAQQKRISRLLRKVELQSKANLAAFIEVFRRWNAYTQTLTDAENRKTRSGSVIGVPQPKESPDDTLDPRIQKTWRNYTAFLCALGGVCLQSGDGMLQSYQSEQNSLKDELIAGLMGLITSEVHIIRKSVTGTIGTDLSPALYEALFQSLQKTVAGYFGDAGQLNMTSSSTLFVEQAISIVKAIIEQQQGEEDFAIGDFETLISSFVKYCAYLTFSTETVRIKCRLCQLIELLLSKKDMIIFRSEFRFRTDLLKQIIEWTSDFILKSDPSARSSEEAGSMTSRSAAQNMSAFKELDMRCMCAIGALLDGLALISEGSNSQSKDDTKSREFFKYFTFLSRYLIKQDKDSHPLLRESTIRALGNLLASNINYGLQYFMKMAYHEDEDTRAAFLSVLTNIIKEDTLKRLGGEKEEIEQSEKYDKLIKLLEADNFALIFVLSDILAIQEQDETCQALIKVFEQRGNALDLIRVAITNEVKSTTQLATLFRANSTSSKLLTAYSKLKGTEFMQRTLQKPIVDLCANPGLFEIDPNRVKPNQDIHTNLEHLCKTTQVFLDAIYKSISYAPRCIREICTHLALAVESHFPGVADTYSLSVASFILLRFFCPAIAAPQTYQLVDNLPDADTRRCLLLVTKIITNIGNNVLFGKKEESMIPVNPFIEKNLPIAKEFFHELATLPSDDQAVPDVEPEISQEEKTECMTVVHRYLFNYLDNLLQELAKRTPSAEEKKKEETTKLQSTTTGGEQANEEEQHANNRHSVSSTTADEKRRSTTVAGKSIAERVSAIVAELGQPPEPKSAVKAPPASTGSDHVTSHMIELIKKMEKVDTSEIEKRELFYHHGTSKNKRPVFYFVPHNWSPDDDPDFVAFYIVKTLRPLWNSPYELVFDSTLWDSQQDIQLSWVSYMAKMLPPVARKNCKAFYVFNPNSHFKATAKLLGSKGMLSKKRLNKVVFISSMKQLTHYIDEKELKLCSQTDAIMNAYMTTFSPATRILSHHSKKNAMIKLSDKLLFIITLQENILQQQVDRTDMVYIVAINEVKEEGDDVIIKCLDDKSIVIRTPMKEQLLMQLKSTIIRQRRDYLLAAVHEGKTNKGIRPTDIPGYVLNMCFLNLASPSPITRAAAYNLLNAAAEQFRFPITHLLMECPAPPPAGSVISVGATAAAPGASSDSAPAPAATMPVSSSSSSNALCVPNNTQHIVLSMSDVIAKSHKNLTMEFLTEALSGFTTVKLPYKYDCLLYMKPWIKNLPSVYQDAIQPPSSDNANEDQQQQQVLQDKLDKLKYWLTALAKATIPSGESKDLDKVYPSVLSEIWAEVGRDSTIRELALESVLALAIENGIGSPATETISDIIITLAGPTVETCQCVVKTLINKILAVLEKEVQSASEPLDAHPPWAKVIIFCRFLLMLAFQNKINVLQNLPHLFHIITLLVGRGNIYVRSTILSLTLNIINSLCIALNFTNEQKHQMRNLASQLHKSKFKIIFLGSNMESLDPFAHKATKSKNKLEEVDMWGIETLTQFMLDILNTCINANSTAAKYGWHDTWVELCKNAALNGNVILMPRVLTVNGVLVRNPAESKDMLLFLLDCLSNNLSNYAQTPEVDLTTSILLALGQFLMKLSSAYSATAQSSSATPTSATATATSSGEEVCKRLMILPLMMLPFADAKLFPAVLHFFSCSLRAIESSAWWLKDEASLGVTVESYFNKYCRGGGGGGGGSSGSDSTVATTTAVDAAMKRMENATGTSFRSNFSFAVAAMLMKGLTHQSTKATTLAFLSSLVNLSAKTATSSTTAMMGSDSLGYLTSLMPFNNLEDLENLKKSVMMGAASSSMSVMDSRSTSSFFTEDIFANSVENAVLFTNYLLTLVNYVDVEIEKVRVFEILHQAFQSLPRLFSPVFGLVFERVIQMYSTANSAKIADMALTLIQPIFTPSASAAAAATSSSSKKQHSGDESGSGQVVQLAAAATTADDLAASAAASAEILKSIHFQGIGNFGSFDAMPAAVRKECVTICLEYINSLFQALSTASLE